MSTACSAIFYGLVWLGAASEPPQTAEKFTPSAEFQEWITAIVRQHIPAEYEKRKNWGNTAKTLDGVSVRLDRGKLKTHRKYREANDGTWQMYLVKLKNPEQNFDIEIANLRVLEGGHVALDVTVVAELEVFARQQQWEHGVQVYSVSAAADARVRLWSQVDVATRLDFAKLPPDVCLDPEVTAARFEIPEFRLRRLGDFHGPVVKALSHATREVLEEKLADDNAKLIAGLNKQIARQEKKLRLSMADVLKSKWGEQLSESLSAAAARR